MADIRGWTGPGDMPLYFLKWRGGDVLCFVLPTFSGADFFVMHSCTALTTYIAVFKRLHDVQQCKACKLNCTLVIWRLTGIVKICLTPFHTPTPCISIHRSEQFSLNLVS